MGEQVDHKPDACLQTACQPCLTRALWRHGRFIDGEELARRLETEATPRLTPRMFMHKIQRACSAQVRIRV